MDTNDLIQHNRERWNDLAAANLTYTRPLLDFDKTTAREWLLFHGTVPAGVLDNLQGQDVLCLASGGGQQSAAFGVLGANVTVFDLSDTQLARDQEAANHYGYSLTVEQGDMQDLSRFADDSFDLIWQPYSINFVPDARAVLHGVARILRSSGYYRLQFANPFLMELEEENWDGNGYPLNQAYVDEAEVLFASPEWDVWQDDGTIKKVVGPREFRHALSTIINELIGHGFTILGVWEDTDRTVPDAQAKPGTWEHLLAVAPQFMRLWARKLEN